MVASLSRTTLGAVLLFLACSTPSGTTNPPVDDSGTTPTDLGTTPTDTGTTPTDTGTTPTDRGSSGDGGGTLCQATTCGACTPMGRCGWCRRTNRCMEGVSSGSTDMSCGGADWAYLPSQCGGDGGTPPVNCETSTDCAACSSRLNCGWCRTSNRCLQGTSTGSMDMSCTGAAWAYFSSQCSGDGGTTMSCRNVPRTCGLTLSGGVRTCTPGAMVTAGCNQGCSPALGSCTGDAVIQVCPASATTAPCAVAMVIASNDDAPESANCGGDGGGSRLCPVTTFRCPEDGRYTLWVGAYDAMAMATCTPAVR